jgi:hypothetical protein
VGKPNERERFYYSALGKYITTTITLFQPREKPLTAQNPSHQNLPRFPCHSPYSCIDLLKIEPCKMCSEQVVVLSSCTNDLLQKTRKKLPRKTCSKLPRFSCPSLLLYGLYRSVQYNMYQQHTIAYQNINSSLGFAPLFSWKTCPPCCPLSSLKLTQKSLKLFLSICLAHYPMHSFINLKMTFSLQSVFSPFPTLNPKAKI